MIGLPTLTTLDRSTSTRIWLATQPADMRCGFDRLAALAQNSLFVGNERGGQTAAILSSLTSTCRRHGIDPQHYLTQLLTNLPDTPMSQLRQWLPDQWKNSQPAPPRA